MQHKPIHFYKHLNFMKYVLLYFFCVLGSLYQLTAQQSSVALDGKTLQNKVRFNFIPVAMPTDFDPNLKATMGLLGAHYQVPITSKIYGSVGMHAALTGDQGGLFTLGVALGIKQPIYKNISLDANFHFGGGGGYRYLINSGGFINPNIGLQYQTDNFAFGVQYSHLDFYTGVVKSNSVSFFVEIPSILRFTSYQKAHQDFTASDLSKSGFWKRPAIRNVQQIRFDFFFPFGNSRKDNANNQEPLRETLYVLGFEYQKYISENTFLFAHTDAIYKGIRAGFMDLFFGAGYHPYQSRHINIFTKLGVGAAGGRVAPEGGLMVYPSAGIDLKLSPKFALSGHGGYYRAIAGDLEAYTLGFGIKYLSWNGGTEKIDSNQFYTQGVRVSVQNQTYFNTPKTDDANADLQLLALQFNYDLTKTFYLIGEAGFAYGGKSGGYAHGLAGLGIYSPRFFGQRMRAHLEGMVGAAGGAGVDTDEGIVVRPNLGLSYQVSDGLAIFASAGKMIAPFGGMNVTNVNVGLSFGLATLAAKSKK